MLFTSSVLTQTNDQLIINGTTGPAGKYYAQVILISFTCSR